MENISIISNKCKIQRLLFSLLTKMQMSFKNIAVCFVSLDPLRVFSLYPPYKLI